MVENNDYSYVTRRGNLNLFERIILKTCCYFPVRKRRNTVTESAIDIESQRNTYERAFGEELWEAVKGKRVLDVGCGEGGYVLAIANEKAKQVDGIDVLDRFHVARTKASELGLDNVRFLQDRLESVESSSYDVVISHDSFEHFAEPEKMLDELLRVTKDTGSLLIKFGPPWRSPWGRHMSGTYRKDRPWIHLLIPERTIMRVHSAYHDKESLLEKYSELEVGLNKMTVKRFESMLKSRPVKVADHKLTVWRTLPLVANIPLVREYFVTGVFVHLRKESTVT